MVLLMLLEHRTEKLCHSVGKGVGWMGVEVRNLRERHVGGNYSEEKTKRTEAAIEEIRSTAAHVLPAVLRCQATL